MKPADPLKDELERLAIQIARDVQIDGVAADRRLDALKTLTVWWSSSRKIDAKKPADDDDGEVIPSMDKMIASLNS